MGTKWSVETVPDGKGTVAFARGLRELSQRTIENRHLDNPPTSVLHLTDRLPVSALAALRERLVETDSDSERSLYAFECGCHVFRPIGSGECNIVWCREHRWHDG